MPSTILVVTNKVDPHADEVIRHLQEQGVCVFRLNTEDLCFSVHPEVRICNSKFIATFKSTEHQLDLLDVRSAWYRRPKRRAYSHIEDEGARQFARAEAGAFVEWLWEATNCFWVSKPKRIRASESKLLQLRMASRLGLSVPKTLITNDPSAVRKFYDECQGNVINKVLAGGMVTRDGATFHVYTNRLNIEDLAALDGVRDLPCLFQERIEKAYELRVTVVGRKVFAARIDSQASVRTKDDWRRYDFENTPHYTCALPNDVEAFCINLVREFDLVFGAIDMIVTPDGDYVFLEVNPNGQWLWIERLTGHPIAEAIAGLLVRGSLD